MCFRVDKVHSFSLLTKFDSLFIADTLCFAIFHVTLFHWAFCTIHVYITFVVFYSWFSFSLHCSWFVTQHCWVLGCASWCRWGTLSEMGHTPSDPVHARGLQANWVGIEYPYLLCMSCIYLLFISLFYMHFLFNCNALHCIFTWCHFSLDLKHVHTCTFDEFIVLQYTLSCSLLCQY